MKLSIVCATYNRADLLDRALQTYVGQSLLRSDWEYILVDDCSTDHTKHIVKKYKPHMNITVLDAAKDLGLPKQPNEWRDGCKLRNSGSTFANGEVIVSTHPEIMIPKNALKTMYETSTANPDSWITAIPYWLPNVDIDEVEWRKDLQALRTVPGFYDPSWPDPIHSPGAPDYRNQNQETRKDWESEVFWAMQMAKWRWLGGFRNFDQWGSVDMDFLGRRSTAKIPTIVAQSSPGQSLMVYHQWHESKRDMDLAMKGVENTDYSSLQKMREQGGLYNVYYHAVRERANDGKLGGIMPDHINRYKFAQTLTSPDFRVLDVGCGTGYGSLLFPDETSYTGIDVDSESIQWANLHYSMPNHQFKKGSATFIPEPDKSFDLVCCFEVLEHVENPYSVLKNLRRVLKPSGILVLSTPQKGATGGTPWDRYMLTNQELCQILDECNWSYTEFHQPRYGLGEVTPGKPPADAEIQIIVGSPR